MSKKSSNPNESLQSMEDALELLHSRIIDIEALAHAAEETLQHLPYIPRPPRALPEPTEELRLHFGRLHALIAATAAAARTALSDVEQLVGRAPVRTTPDNGSSKAGEPWRPTLHGSGPRSMAASSTLARFLPRGPYGSIPGAWVEAAPARAPRAARDGEGEPAAPAGSRAGLRSRTESQAKQPADTSALARVP